MDAPEQDISTVVASLACLGRKVSLGMLYDYRSHQVVPAISLWDDSSIKLAVEAIENNEDRKLKIEIVEISTFSQKAKQLHMSQDLKLSLLLNLFPVNGAGNLFYHASKRKELNICLKYSSYPRSAYLDVDKMGSPCYQQNAKFATHLVVNITFGFELFIIFKYSISETENGTEIKDTVIKVIKKISKGLDISQLDARSKQVLAKCNCIVYSDLMFTQGTYNVWDAVKLMQDLPLRIASNNITLVPKLAALLPLKCFLIKPPVVVCEISSSIIDQIEIGIDEITTIEDEARKCLTNSEQPLFQTTTLQLAEFIRLVAIYKSNTIQRLGSLVCYIKEGKLKEKYLYDAIQEKFTTPFHPHTLAMWISEKQSESKLLNRHIGSLYQCFISKQDDILTAMKSNTFVFSLEFQNLPEIFDAGLMRMYSNLSSVPCDIDATYKPWHKNESLKHQIFSTIRMFRVIAERNQNIQGTEFVITNNNEIQNLQYSNVDIILYENGKPKKFEVPRNLEQPISIETQQTSITLSWKKPNHGAESITSYYISYSLTSDFKVMKTIECHTRIYMVKISSLKPNTLYYFKLCARCKGNISMESESIIAEKTEKELLPQRIKNKAELLKIECGSIKIFKPSLKPIYKGTGISKLLLTENETPVCKYPEKVLIVVGATGAGKSTLINGMLNYILCVQWKDKFRFKVIHDEGDQAVSQTKEITAYTIHRLEGSQLPYDITIIDTPGFGDTSGIEADKKIVQQIKDFFSVKGKQGIDHLDGIGFVAQSPSVRLTHTQKYIFDSILAIFGKDMKENIFILTTFADGKHPPVITAITAGNIPYSSFHKFNNSVLFTDNLDDNGFDEKFWNLGYRSFSSFFNRFEQTQPVSLQLTEEVLSEREDLETTVQGLQRKVNEVVEKLEELRQIEQTVQQRKGEMESRKDFTVNLKVPQTKKIDLPTGRFVTNCLNCNHTCHYPCYIANDNEKYNCAAMRPHSSDAKCTVCPGKCSWEKHVNNTYRFEIETVTVTRTAEDIKKQYYTAVEGKGVAETVLCNLQQCLKCGNEEAVQMIKRTQKCLRRLDEIALKPNPLTEVEYIQLLIQSEKHELKAGYQARLKVYEEALQQAKIISKAKDEKLDEPEEQQKSANNYNWLKRFKFW